MHIDGRLVYKTLREVPEIAKMAERLGFDGLWTHETDHEPFLGAALALEHTSRITVGTSIALAFTRSPTELAHLTWDLAQLSSGRFVLGLGTQVKAHITRRFGMPWDPPAPKLRDVVGAIRAVWTAWSERRPLDFRGRYVSLSLMTPFFTPPGPPPRLHIETAGVGARMCRLSGEVADGFHVHPFHTRRYLREVVIPQLEAGIARSGRARADFVVNAHVFVAAGTAAEVARLREEIRRAVAFYGSTPAYRPLLTFHGWTGIGEELSRRAARGEWNDMPALVTDDMLEHFAIWGPPDEAAARLRAEYGGLADRLSTYDALVPGQRLDMWRVLLSGLRAAG